MERHSRGGTLRNVRSRTIALSCAFAFSLLLSSTTYALSVEPVLDTAVSVAKLNEPKATSERDNRRELRKAEDRTSATSSSLSNKTPDTTVESSPTVTAAPEPAIIPAPIEELHSIDTSEMKPQTLRIYRPVTTLAVSHEVLGATTADSVTPLQASAHGWKLFNVAWYWWLVGGIGAFYGTQRMVRYRQSVKVDTI